MKTLICGTVRATSASVDVDEAERDEDGRGHLEPDQEDLHQVVLGERRRAGPGSATVPSGTGGSSPRAPGSSAGRRRSAGTRAPRTGCRTGRSPRTGLRERVDELREREADRHVEDRGGGLDACGRRRRGRARSRARSAAPSGSAAPPRGPSARRVPLVTSGIERERDGAGDDELRLHRDQPGREDRGEHEEACRRGREHEHVADELRRREVRQRDLDGGDAAIRGRRATGCSGTAPSCRRAAGRASRGRRRRSRRR